MPISPGPDFLDSFDAGERSFRDLPHIGEVVPPPVAPNPAVLDEWLRPYRSWSLPTAYVAFIERYGGVHSVIPTIGVGIRPVEKLLAYRREREAVGEVFATRQIPLSHANTEGVLRLVFSDDGAQPRVGFMNAQDDIDYVADSFSTHLWVAVFSAATIFRAPHREFTSVGGIPRDDVESYNLRLADALRASSWEILAADRRVVSGRRGDTCFATSVRGPTSVGVTVGRDADHHAMMRDHAEIVATMASTR